MKFFDLYIPWIENVPTSTSKGELEPNIPNIMMEYYQNSINFFWIAIVFYRFGFQFSTVWYKISSVEMYSEENIDVFTKSWQSNLFVTNT